MNIQTEDLYGHDAIDMVLNNENEECYVLDALIDAQTALGHPLGLRKIFSAINSARNNYEYCPKVSKVLQSAFDPQMLGEETNEVLHYCITKDAVAAMRAVLGHPLVDIDARNRSGLTPLHFASQSGSIASVVTLLESGAALELECGSFDFAKNKRGRTALCLAAEAKREKIMQLVRHLYVCFILI